MSGRQVWLDNETSVHGRRRRRAERLSRRTIMLGAWRLRPEAEDRGRADIHAGDRAVRPGSLCIHGDRPGVPERRHVPTVRSAIPKVLAIDSTFVGGTGARLAMALTMLGQYDEAELQVRRALRERHQEWQGDRMVPWTRSDLQADRRSSAGVRPPPRMSPSDTAQPLAKCHPSCKKPHRIRSGHRSQTRNT